MKDVSHFEANAVNDPVFASALKDAANKGVKILAVDCFISEKEMKIEDFVRVKI